MLRVMTPLSGRAARCLLSHGAVVGLSCMLFADAASAQVAYTDSQGRQWRQVAPTVARSWHQVAAVCPVDGITPCSGALGNQSVTGWVWATREDVIELFSEWVPAVSGSGEAGGPEHTLAGLQFFATFNYTDFYCTVVGCFYGVAGWTSTSVPGNAGSAYVAAVGAGYNPNYGSFSANMTAPAAEISMYRGVWMYLPARKPPCAADLDGDGNVGSIDLATLLAAWGAGGDADLDGSGAVDAIDLSTLLAAWGDC